jgi:hypothetical protein
MRNKLSSPCSSILFAIFATALLAISVRADDPYRFFTWNVTYGDIWPLGVKQQVYLY